MFANSGETDIVRALKDKPLDSFVRVEGTNNITFAVSCRHCVNPLCVSACISGALTKNPDGVVVIDKNKCVGCGSCIMMCPYGAVKISKDGVANKCELCTSNLHGSPYCVTKCPNGAIVYEER
jgi:carbon-monoxide dehydrogenase iron sulfur subunit